MALISSPISTPQTMPVVARGSLARAPGFKHLTRSEFNAAVISERNNILLNSGNYAAGERLYIHGEEGYRSWFIGFGDTIAAIAQSSHARTVCYSKRTVRVLALDSSVARSTVGAPADSVGADGDEAIDRVTGFIYLKILGVWGYVTTDGGYSSNGGSSPEVPLVFGSDYTATMSKANGNAFLSTLTANSKLLNPVGYTQGDRITLVLQQNSVGGNTLTFDTNYGFSNGTLPDIRTQPGDVHLLEFYFTGAGFFITRITDAFSKVIGSVVYAVLDDETQLAYSTAINEAAVGNKRQAGAEAVIAALQPDSRLSLYQDGILVAQANFSGSPTIAADSFDLWVSMDELTDATVLVAANINTGVWTYVIEGGAGYAHQISGLAGNTTSGNAVTLSESLVLGAEFSITLKLMLPRSLDA